MATTLTLGDTASFAQSFGGFKQLFIGNSLNPGITAGNMILTTLLSPPFVWNWNRAAASFVTVIGQQDYTVSIPTFGFIEKASYSDGTKIAEITNMQGVLGIGTEPGLPAFIAPQIDDNAGNITFRLLPVPDQVYTISLIFQKRIPALMTSTASKWAPVPDHYSHLYQWGFLAVIAAYFEDPRWAQFSQKFVSSVLSMAEGLQEEQKNVFQKTWLDMVSEQQGRSQRTSQGIQNRQV